MVIALPGVLSSLGNAQSKATQTMATKISKAAVEYIREQELNMTPVSTGTLLSAETLGVSLGNYTGFAVVGANSTATIYLTSGTYCMAGVKSDVVSKTAPKQNGVKSGKKVQYCPTKYNITYDADKKTITSVTPECPAGSSVSGTYNCA